MSEQLTLSAETRERAGKGASRAMRREGRVPAVVYGNKEEPLAVHVEEKALIKMLSTGHFMNSVVMVEVAGLSGMAEACRSCVGDLRQGKAQLCRGGRFERCQ